MGGVAPRPSSARVATESTVHLVVTQSTEQPVGGGPTEENVISVASFDRVPPVAASNRDPGDGITRAALRASDDRVVPAVATDDYPQVLCARRDIHHDVVVTCVALQD